MNLFKKKKNTANTISHVLNKKKRKFPEPIVTIRQIEERDVNEVRQLLHDHFNSLTLPAVVYWSIQHIYDLLVITAINYIFFLDIRKICYFLGIFVIYLYIRAKLEFLRHIRKDCPDLDNLYKSYVNVEGCNFWVAEVFDNNSDSVSRTTCSDIYEREKVICENEKEEQTKVSNNDRDNESVREMNSGDEEAFKNEKKYETAEENVMKETFQKLDEKVDEQDEKEFENGDLKHNDGWKFDEHNEHVDGETERDDKEKEKETEGEGEERNEDEYIDIGKNEGKSIIVKNTESDKHLDKTELTEEEGNEKIHRVDSENATNDSSCKHIFDDSKNKSTNDLIEEMKNNKTKDTNSYTCVYSENSNHHEQNKGGMGHDNSASSLMEDKEKELKLQNKNETVVVNLDNKCTTATNNNSNTNNGNSLNSTTSSNNCINNSRMKDDEENNMKYINRKIVGCVGIVPYKGDNSIAQLVRMVVKKDNRRMRIGSRLLTQLENFAYEQNYKELKVFTNNLNTDSLYFVKQHGFNLSQIVRRGLMRGDLLIWSKILNKDEFYKFNSTDLQSYTTNILD